MKTEAYTFTITSSCPQERTRRVFEHIKRGFMPVKFYQYETERSHTTNNHYRDSFGEMHRQTLDTGSTTYCATMRGRKTCKS